MSDMQPLVASSKAFRREFNDSTFADWTLTTGPGMTVAATGGALVVTTGTTINSETVLTSKEGFSVPFRASFGFKISQKIANQEFYVEVVAENDESIVAAWRIAGSDVVTNTVARYEVRNGGAARWQSANTSTIAAQTVDSLYEITVENDEVWFTSKLQDSTSSRYTPFVKNAISPDPTRRYRLRYRIKNGSTAPASTTTFTSANVTCVDYSDQKVEITGGTGDIGGANAVPVYTVGGASINVASGFVSPSASVTNVGTLIAKVNSAATTNLTSVKASAARLFGFHLYNSNAAVRYLKLYNKASAPVLASDVPVMIVPLQGATTQQIQLSHPAAFATGLAYAITTGLADTDATAVAAGEIVGSLIYF